ncbi:MAG: flotillin [bacterium]|jgi:flotillin
MSVREKKSPSKKRKRQSATELFNIQQNEVQEQLESIQNIEPEKEQEQVAEELEFEEEFQTQNNLSENEVNVLLDSMDEGAENEEEEDEDDLFQQKLEMPQKQMMAPAMVVPVQNQMRREQTVSRSITPPSPAKPKANSIPLLDVQTSEDLQLEKEPIKVRETGFWFWRRIIVPPNAYVVHTRIGKKAPVTLGLGLSFRYNPNTDAYLVVQAAMQTIGVVANCISQEKQGINVLAYVQWQIDDFSIAYKKLDFTDTYDPLGIVNAQLREQAEAAIKDKISTMTVEDVLTDKAPVIEELTARLKGVAEGRKQDEEGQATHEGLGIKIVTVQIREAIVSSQKLWEDLQAPFRHDQDKAAQVSYLQMQDELRKTELETKKDSETRQAKIMFDIEQIKQSKQTEKIELQLKEESTRFTKEQESTQKRISLEEQTKLAKKQSEQRIFEKELELKKYNELAQLTNQEQTVLAKKESEQKLLEKEVGIQQQNELQQLQAQQKQQVEQSRLDNERRTNQKTLETEESLHQLAEDARVTEENTKNEKVKIEQATQIEEERAKLNKLTQQYSQEIEELILKEELDARQKRHDVEIQERTDRDKLKMSRQIHGQDLLRLEQEVHNLTNDQDLLAQFIDILPRIAREMPEIHELKVLQTGGENGTGLDAFTQFLHKALAMADSLGVSIPLKEEVKKALPTPPIKTKPTK